MKLNNVFHFQTNNIQRQEDSTHNSKTYICLV